MYMSSRLPASDQFAQNEKKLLNQSQNKQSQQSSTGFTTTPNQQTCPAISIKVRGQLACNTPIDIHRKTDSLTPATNTKFQPTDLSNDSRPSSLFATASTATQPRTKKHVNSLFNDGFDDDSDLSSYITTVKQQYQQQQQQQKQQQLEQQQHNKHNHLQQLHQQQLNNPHDLKSPFTTRLQFDTSSTDKPNQQEQKQQLPMNSQSSIPPVVRLAFSEDQLNKKPDIFGRKAGTSNISVNIDSKKENIFSTASTSQENIFTKIGGGGVFDVFAPPRKPDSALTTVKNYADTPNIASLCNSTNSNNNSNKTLTSKGSSHFNLNQSTKRPFFLFEDDYSNDSKQSQISSISAKGTSGEQIFSQQPKKTFNEALDSLWNDARFQQLKKAHLDIWDEPEKPSREQNMNKLEQSFGQAKKQKQSNVLPIDRFGKQPSHKEAFSQKSQQFVPFEKVLFSTNPNSRNSNGRRDDVKYYEFNCFKDSDLNMDDAFKTKFQDLSLDDDVQSDDGQIDHYIEVCFTDLIEAIDMQHKDSQRGSSKAPPETDHLWDYFNPPCHAEETSE